MNNPFFFVGFSRVDWTPWDAASQGGVGGGDISRLKASAMVKEVSREPSHLLLGEELFALLHVGDDGVAAGFPAGGAHCGRGERTKCNVRSRRQPRRFEKHRGQSACVNNPEGEPTTQGHV